MCLAAQMRTEENLVNSTSICHRDERGGERSIRGTGLGFGNVARETTGADFVGRRRASSSSSSSSTEEASTYNVGAATNIKWHESPVTREARERRLNQRGCVLWMTGLSGSGKSTVAFTLEHLLHEKGKTCYVLDGDNLRHGLNKDLGFSAESREENIRRIGEVAKIFAQAGIITMVSIISPYAKDRNRAREAMENKDFVEVYMKIPLAVCEQRDPKGLYRKARSGEIKGFTGIDAPYEAPQSPEITLHVSKSGEKTPQDMAHELLRYLEENRYLEF